MSTVALTCHSCKTTWREEEITPLTAEYINKRCTYWFIKDDLQSCLMTMGALVQIRDLQYGFTNVKVGIVPRPSPYHAPFTDPHRTRTSTVPRPTSRDGEPKQACPRHCLAPPGTTASPAVRAQTEMRGSRKPSEKQQNEEPLGLIIQ